MNLEQQHSWEDYLLTEPPTHQSIDNHSHSENTLYILHPWSGRGSNAMFIAAGVADFLLVRANA